MKLSLSAVATALALTLAACAGPSSGDASTTDSASELNASAPITMQNWLTHPKIAAIREIVNEIDAAEIAPETKTGLCEGSGHGESERSITIDAHLVPRELTMSGGSEDSAATDSYYYDAAGKLRFFFRTHNDVHGNQREYRVYFDENGTRIWGVNRFAFSETFDADITKSPYEAPAEPTEIDPLADKPQQLFDSPVSCD